jgi:hypothetical protein
MSPRRAGTRPDTGEDAVLVHVTAANNAAAVPLHRKLLTLKPLRILGVSSSSRHLRKRLTDHDAVGEASEAAQWRAGRCRRAVRIRGISPAHCLILQPLVEQSVSSWNTRGAGR